MMAAEMFFGGKGVQKNDAQGVKYATMAANKGKSLPASLKVELARCYMTGSGTAKNEEKAWKLVMNTAYLDSFITEYPTQWDAYTAKHPEAKQAKNVAAFTMSDAPALPTKESSSSKPVSNSSVLSFGNQPDADRNTSAKEDKVYDVVEQMPAFPGGPTALFKYLSDHIIYPVEAQEDGIGGRVICTFVVERDGSIVNVNVVKSVHPALDKESIRVIKSMPKWIPGRTNGRAVCVKYSIPITFR
ncbi:MAG: TonB family protein [Prevotella sp.]|nr:TonB family protein [Prevotella sp.]